MTVIIKSDVKSSRSMGNTSNPSIMDGLSVLLDFNRERYVHKVNNALVDLNISDALSVTRASTAEYTALDGSTKKAGINEPRIHYMPKAGARGLLVEEEATNLLSNPYAPATQVVALNATGSGAVGLILTVEGSGSATISGSVTPTNAAAKEGSPQVALIEPNSPAGNITVTVTGELTRFQLVASASVSSGVYASTFVAQGETKRAVDIVKTGSILDSKIKTMRTLVINVVIGERYLTDSVLRTRFYMHRVYNTAGTTNKGILQAIYLLQNRYLDTRIVPENGANSLATLGIGVGNRITSVIAYNAGGLGATHAINGLANDMADAGEATVFDRIDFTHSIPHGGVITHVAIYDRKLSEDEIKEASTYWL